MGVDWESILDTDDLAEAWDLAVADVLYQDHPRADPGQPADPGDDEPFIPINESGSFRRNHGLLKDLKLSSRT